MYVIRGLWAVFFLILVSGCVCTNIESQKKSATEYTLHSPTYSFDGSDLNYIDYGYISEGSCSIGVEYNFTSKYSGYGDRTGMILTEEETPHTLDVTVTEKGEIIRAGIDHLNWDEFNQQYNVIGFGLLTEKQCETEECWESSIKGCEVGTFFARPTGKNAPADVQGNVILDFGETDTGRIEAKERGPGKNLCEVVYETRTCNQAAGIQCESLITGQTCFYLEGEEVNCFKRW